MLPEPEVPEEESLVPAEPSLAVLAAPDPVFEEAALDDPLPDWLLCVLVVLVALVPFALSDEYELPSLAELESSFLFPLDVPFSSFVAFASLADVAFLFACVALAAVLLPDAFVSIAAFPCGALFGWLDRVVKNTTVATIAISAVTTTNTPNKVLLGFSSRADLLS